jgi:predicted permease
MKLYRALLHLYPASFRGEYGEEMCAIHARRRRDASNLPLLWIETFFDILSNALRVHFDMLRQDALYAARIFARSPGFSLTAIAVAALGIGATTAAFTMVDHVLLRPLPFADQDRLAKLWESPPGYRHTELSPVNYRDVKQMSTSYETMGCYRGLIVDVVGQGDPRQVEGASMTAELLPMLGVKAEIGRIFTAEDDRDTAPGTVVLSDSLWQSVFGGDASVLGRRMVLDNQPYTIIGVMPRDFHFPNRDALLWTAMRFAPADFEDRANTYIYGVAKLKRGVSLSSAAAEMKLVASRIERANPKEMTGVGITVESLRDDIAPQSRMALYVLLAAAGCVLLVACANLANLLLARALVRRKELAVRAAMGAGRERLIRQMLTESLLLAGVGGMVGVALAYFSLPLFVKLVPTQLPVAEIPSIDFRVLLCAAVATCGTGIFFGLAPALRVFRGADSAGLSRAGVRRERLRSALVVAEICGSVVLLVACGLLMRALWRIQAIDPGFRPENVLTLRTSLPMPKYERTVAREQFYRRVLSDAQALPGVTGVAYTSFLPMVARGGLWAVEIEGRPMPVAERQNASLRFVTPGYFSAMGIPLLSGRDVAESDIEQTQMVAVISESFARYYWPGENPIGRRFNFAFRDRTVAGVVGNVRVRGLERASEPQVYLPYKQVPDGGVIWYAPKDLVVRSTMDPVTLAPALRRIVHEADPEQPVSDVRTLSEIVSAETETRRVQAIALGSFALIAFVLAAIGIHGLLSFAVSSRTQEIGVRMALGASSGDILRMILNDAALLAAIGIAIGGVCAYAAGRQLQALLAGVNPGDPATFLGAIGLCAVMTMAGSLLPAARAIRLDAAKAIRTE